MTLRIDWRFFTFHNFKNKKKILWSNVSLVCKNINILKVSNLVSSAFFRYKRKTKKRRKKIFFLTALVTRLEGCNTIHEDEINTATISLGQNKCYKKCSLFSFTSSNLPQPQYFKTSVILIKRSLGYINHLLKHWIWCSKVLYGICCFDFISSRNLYFLC